MSLKDLISDIKDKGAEPAEDTEAEFTLSDALPPDPAPARRTAKTRTAKPAPPAVTAKIKSQVADSLTLFLLGPVTVWEIRDPVCGGVAAHVLENAVNRAVPIVCRNPGMLRWFTEGQGWMEWMALGSALSPLAKCVWDHHVVGSGHGSEETADVDVSGFTAPAFA